MFSPWLLLEATNHNQEVQISAPPSGTAVNTGDSVVRLNFSGSKWAVHGISVEAQNTLNVFKKGNLGS